MKNKTLRYGKNNDKLTVDTLERCTVTDQGGVNRISIGNSRVETAIEDSRLTFGGQNTFSANARESAVEDSVLSFSGSRNSLSLKSGESTLEESQIILKGGKNTLSLHGGEDALDESRITLSGQYNRLNIKAGDTALDESRITGAGNDTISLSGRTVMDDSHLSLSRGNNNVSLSGKTAMEHSSLTLGSGADKVNITGNVVQKSRVDTGGGNDSVALRGTLSGSSLKTGSGKDAITLHSAAALKSGAVIDGGSGRDTLHLHALKGVSLSTLAAAGTSVNNVEIISLKGGSASTLHVNNAGVSRFRPEALGAGPKGSRIERVVGDSKDAVSFEQSEKWSMVRTGGAKTAAEYTLDGVTYNLWKSAAGKQLLVQKGLYTKGDNRLAGGTKALSNETLDYSRESTAKSLNLGGNNGWSLKNSSIKLGSGNDKVVLGGKVSLSSVALGAGNDALTVKGAVTGKQLVSDAKIDAAGTAWTKHVEWSSFSGADGNDSLSFSGSLDNGVSISLGKGNNSLTVAGEVELTRITGDSGLDTVLLKNDVEDSIVSLGQGSNKLTVYGDMEGSLVQTGNGVDSVSIRGELEDSSLNLGGGNDTLTIGSVDNSSINLGSGRDLLTVKGSFFGSLVAESGNDSIVIGGNLLARSTIHLGDGNDSLSLEGMKGGVVHGGNGNDNLTLHLDNTASPFGASGEFSGLFSGGKSYARGFENLILDMEDASRDTLHITEADIARLCQIGSSSGADRKAGIDLWVAGDMASGRADTLLLDGSADDYTQRGTAKHDGSVFDHFITDDNTDLFVQQGILLDFGG